MPYFFQDGRLQCFGVPRTQSDITHLFMLQIERLEAQMKGIWVCYIKANKVQIRKWLTFQDGCPLCPQCFGVPRTQALYLAYLCFELNDYGLK